MIHYIQYYECLRCRATWKTETYNTQDSITTYRVSSEGARLEEVCTDCQCTEYLQRLPGEAIAKIDQMIFQRDILTGIRAYKVALQIGLKEAMELYSWRYNQLRISDPDHFIEGPEGYWEGFYS